MKFLLRVGAFIYVSLVLSISCLILFYVFGIFEIQYVLDYISIYQLTEEYQLAVGIAVGLLTLLTVVFYRVFLMNIQQDKVIAFDNPSGRVSVSLLALEDLIKRKIKKVYEVRDVKTKIRAAGRKGLQVKIMLIMRAEGHIPDITANVQDIVKNKIQDVIGLDEDVNIYVYIGKIIPDEVHTRREQEEKEEDKTEPNIPFQGYRA
jgi:uncharacterized alkaline shock family protein YloU